MFEEFIFQKLWIVLPVWLIVYLADYYLTIIGARYYKTGANEHIAYQGSYELTPQFQSDIDALRLFSPKFIRVVLISSVLLVVLWFASSQEPDFWPFFRFLFGGLILREIVILLRHAKNITIFWNAKKHRGISGQVRYDRWFTYRMSFVELFGFAVVFLIVFLFTGSYSFLGGSVLVGFGALKDLKASCDAIKKKNL